MIEIKIGKEKFSNCILFTMCFNDNYRCISFCFKEVGIYNALYIGSKC